MDFKVPEQPYLDPTLDPYFLHPEQKAEDQRYLASYPQLIADAKSADERKILAKQAAETTERINLHTEVASARADSAQQHAFAMEGATIDLARRASLSEVASVSLSRLAPEYYFDDKGILQEKVWIYLAVNPMLCELRGQTRTDIEGKALDEINPPAIVREKIRPLIEQAVSQAEAGDERGVTTVDWFGFPGREESWWQTVYRPITAKNPLTGQPDFEIIIETSNVANLKRAETEVIESLIRASSQKDNETGHHLVRTQKYCELIGTQLGLTSQQVDHIARAAPMHDVGKIGIPDAILHKPGKLDDAEWSKMQEHALIGGEILSGGGFSELLRTAHDVARYHHENYDGSGYPDSLVGETIPLPARIMAVADVWDALTTRRPYKEPWTPERALALLREESGRKFDPQIVELFARADTQVQVRKIMGELGDIS